MEQKEIFYQAMSNEYNNLLFVVNKSLFISSNNYLRKVKRKYNIKKIGFSGTLDPFAKGTLICATNQYTKLFRFLNKSPKLYQGTIWLGAESESLDIENITEIKNHKLLNINDIINVVEELKKEKYIKYTPPKYCAKKVNGVKAYKLARKNADVKLDECVMEIFDIKLINYNHPFISYEALVSEGSFIRSLSQIILSKLNSLGTMSFLYRKKEGRFSFENEKILDIIHYLNIKENFFSGLKSDFLKGKKLCVKDFKYKDNGIYMINLNDFLSIIEIKDDKVSYLLNRVQAC